MFAALKWPNRPRVKLGNFLLQTTLPVTFDTFQRLDPPHTFVSNVTPPLYRILRVVLGR